jgi:hypothetical protein
MADDIIIATTDYFARLDASASIMVAPAAQSSGANGATTAGGQAYTVATAVAAPSAAPVADSESAQSENSLPTPAIIGFGFAPGDCPNIRFRGFVEGVAYRVVRSTSVDFKPENCEFPDGEIVSVKGDEAIWEGSKPDDPATGAKFYRVEVVRTAAE